MVTWRCAGSSVRFSFDDILIVFGFDLNCQTSIEGYGSTNHNIAKFPTDLFTAVVIMPSIYLASHKKWYHTYRSLLRGGFPADTP